VAAWWCGCVIFFVLTTPLRLITCSTVVVLSKAAVVLELIERVFMVISFILQL